MAWAWCMGSSGIGRYSILTASNGTFRDAEIIKQGYGIAYTRFPYKYMDEFRRYECEATQQNRGLWGKNT